VWLNNHLYLSIGTPLTLRALSADPTVTVHLDSGTEVVVVEGRAIGDRSEAEILEKYNRKYDWSYDVGDHGPLTCVEPGIILPWRAAGWAGRESFQETGRWTFG